MHLWRPPTSLPSDSADGLRGRLKVLVTLSPRVLKAPSLFSPVFSRNNLGDYLATGNLLANEICVYEPEYKVRVGKGQALRFEEPHVHSANAEGVCTCQ